MGGELLIEFEAEGVSEGRVACRLARFPPLLPLCMFTLNGMYARMRQTLSQINQQTMAFAYRITIQLRVLLKVCKKP